MGIRKKIAGTVAALTFVGTAAVVAPASASAASPEVPITSAGEVTIQGYNYRGPYRKQWQCEKKKDLYNINFTILRGCEKHTTDNLWWFVTN